MFRAARARAPADQGQGLRRRGRARARGAGALTSESALRSRAAGGAAALLGLALTAYVAARAASLAITHDEAFTYTRWITAPLARTLTFDGVEPANNHLLNTLLAKGCARVLGPTELPLRLPNLLAFPISLFFVHRLLVRRAGKGLALFGLVLAGANPLALELFGLCRGYGLSLAFLAAALDLADGAIERASPARGAAALLVLGAGALAQLVMVDALAGLATVLVVDAATHARRSRLRDFVPLVSAVAVSAAVLVPILRVLARGHQFYAGGSAGFLEDTFAGLVRASFLRAPAAPALVGAALAAVTALVVLAAGAAAALALRSPKSPSERAALGLLAMPFLTAAAAVAQTRLFAAATLQDRAALVFVPLFAIASTVAAAELAKRGVRLARAVRFGAGAIALLALAHLARVGNVRESSLWWFDADDRGMMDDLTRRHGAERVRLGVTWTLEPSINFYRITRGLDWLQPVTRDPPLGDFDLAYLVERDAPEALRRGWTPVARYETTGNVLVRAPRSSPPPR